MGSHRSKKAKIRGFHLALHTRLGLNELTYTLPINYRYSTVFIAPAYVEHSKAIELVAIKGMHAYRNDQIGPQCKYLAY